MLTLGDIAVESGNDSGAPFAIELVRLAEKFADLYWRQSAPYACAAPGSVAGILSQNLGRQAAVVTELERLREANIPSLVAARDSEQWRETIASIAAVVRRMPIRTLQNIGGANVPFLYEYPPPRASLVLKPGVVLNLRPKPTF